MRLGVNLGYLGAGGAAENLAVAREADRLGFASCWVAEAYGSDAPTLLAYIAAQTDRIGIGSAVLQIPARTPAMTAMTAATLDVLSEGRFRLGLGVSGPQVSEGWHGVRFDKPLGRTREYVEIVNKALSRKPLTHQGEHWTLPLPDGPGKPIKLTLHPVSEHIPIYLASVGPKNLELTGEIADGWLAIFFSPEHAEVSMAPLRAGRLKAGHADGNLDGFDVVPTVPINIADTVEEAAAPIRGYAALYIGGMGSREKNFYNALAVRMGFDAEAAEIQDRFLAKDYQGAADAVPLEFIDATSLIGPAERIAERMKAFSQAGVTTLSLAPFAPDLEGRLSLLRSAAQALDASGVAS